MAQYKLWNGGIDVDLQKKNERLVEILRVKGRVMVAFSGGVDSSVVLKPAN